MTLIAPIHAIDPPLLRLVAQADAYMLALYPAVAPHLTDPATLLQGEGLFVGAYVDEELAGCGAVRMKYDEAGHAAFGEVKRIFVDSRFRGRGISKAIMDVLERHLVDHGIGLVRLETGVRQPEALGLYRKLGYRTCQHFGPGPADPLSVYFEKLLDLSLKT
ncbi:GNAT family N-acetyltransferase [Noviherbaspirillum galbum]|uniref:GNAT family N-acetyltransferase n=1 Tax=Noviherbaspirillum galbum TaxID=2709383 RepID=A0A6B3SXB3_9BURK|nr:GNAT family N-acetyltransferase [Noviherbaspirillum galbum]NEX62389.1 GNAT family N-acetyltransferase [Noviherbaspirillum galbum]